MGWPANRIIARLNVGNFNGCQTSISTYELNQFFPLLRVLTFLPRLLFARALIHLPEQYTKADGQA